MDKITERTLGKWVQTELDKMPRIKRLIGLTKWCLYYGPNMEGQDDETDDDKAGTAVWPGWEEALQQIRFALDTLCSNDVWVDFDCEEVFTSEPQGYEDDNPSYDPDYDVEDDDPDYEADKATPKVWCEPEWSNFCHVGSSEVKKAILGDLAQYV